MSGNSFSLEASDNFGSFALFSSVVTLSLADRFNQCLIDGETLVEDDGKLLARFGV